MLFWPEIKVFLRFYKVFFCDFRGLFMPKLSPARFARRGACSPWIPKGNPCISTQEIPSFPRRASRAGGAALLGFPKGIHVFDKGGIPGFVNKSMGFLKGFLKDFPYPLGIPYGESQQGILIGNPYGGSL